jgi:hypothetical protein
MDNAGSAHFTYVDGNPLASTKAIVWVIPMTDLASANWQSVPLQLNFSLEQPEIQLR